ncbi:MAG TPA: AMED_5909 family protein [Pseudonocardiaceae bacterium]|nr:AMED_5909 family protein [Pseudonocardiaceae bacterium]
MSGAAQERGSGVEMQAPVTLAQAREVLGRARPRRSAPLEEWLAFYQRAAAVYAEVAEIDRGHHHEALAVAGQERERAEKITIVMRSREASGEH